MAEVKPSRGSLRVWHVPNPPREGFKTTVSTVQEAKLVLNALAQYDIYLDQVERDFIWANASGLEEFDGEEWVEWHDEEDNDISDVMRNEQEECK